MRREIASDFKGLTPSPLIDYIREFNIGRYNDPLGPSFDALMERNIQNNLPVRESYRAIISSSMRPNSDIDKLLTGFAQWLSTKPDDFIRMHWENLAPQFGQDPSALADLIRRTQ